MAYIKEYWSDKTGLTNIAKQHTQEMEEKYALNISESIKKTSIYSPDFVNKYEKQKLYSISKIKLIAKDSVTAIFDYHDGKTAVLNFSSYKNPGGMFIEGSKAQEECLCHASNLYNVLVQYKDSFYEWNNKNKNRSLYLNRALYSPEIKFFNDKGECSCDVITCAAPNKSAAQKYLNISNEENSKFLEERILFIFNIAKENNIDTLILGAYGCGVFGQDPNEVAQLFKKYIYKYNGVFKNIIFAIPDKTSKNYQEFLTVFSK